MASSEKDNLTVKYIKSSLLIIASISLASMVACSEEERLPTEQEFKAAKAWLACSQQERWDKLYNQVGTIATRLAVQKECGVKPPFVEED